ncbi:hypothetical protein AURDEDRAFT_156856 [Auricularia subglabra TFB-10046 SS5]|nr:hypothetical protein AURDEDRAFT_156856 [Auricularia subglabra TFB-10046 SS5]
MVHGKHAAKPRRAIKMHITGVDASGVPQVNTLNVGPRVAERRRELKAAERRRMGAEAQVAAHRAASASADNEYTPPGTPNDDFDMGTHENTGRTDHEQININVDLSHELVTEFTRLKRPARFRAPRERRWGDRKAAVLQNWLGQRDELVDAYLRFKHSHTASGPPPPATSSPAVPLNGPLPRGPAQIVVVDISGVYSFAVDALPHPRRNVGLLHLGYLGATPVQPSIAFSVRILMQYTTLKARARTAKQNYVRSLCELHNVPYTRSLRNHFSDAVDAFAMILRAIDEHVRVILGRDGDWRIKNSCPPCSYKCAGEPPLRFARQFTMDGNNSLKRYATPWTRDEAVYPTVYIIAPDEVDMFAGEVSRTTRPSAASEGIAVEYNATDEPCGECYKRWRNSRSDSQRKASWDALEETGSFVCVCRHGFIVCAADMIQSGELAKYGLCVDKTLIDTFGGEGLLEVAYDINCTHSITASRSSFGDDYKRCIVPVTGRFHGHAHNRGCQLDFLSDLVPGSGREPFEGCEQLFSVTNLFASFTRHATRFHRHEDIETAFAVWDQEKYSAMGSLLLSKFQDAYDAISANQSLLLQAQTEYNLNNESFQGFLDGERDFLNAADAVLPPAVDDEMHGEYARSLDRLWKAEEKKKKLPPPTARVRERIQSASDQQRVRAPHNALDSEKKWLAAHRDVVRCEQAVLDFEDRLGILVRWTQDCQEYRVAVNLRAQRACDAALQALELAFVSRINEMDDLNVRNTSYKMRTYIAREIGRRSGAITKLLDDYNKLAVTVDPPRQTLTHAEVLEATVLGDFPLLRYDTGDQPWAQPLFRQMTRAWTATQRAQEEIARVRVEARRVRAWIQDEEALLAVTQDALLATGQRLDVLLAHELCRRASYLHAVHTSVLRDLDELWKTSQ